MTNNCVHQNPSSAKWDSRRHNMIDSLWLKIMEGGETFRSTTNYIKCGFLDTNDYAAIDLTAKGGGWHFMRVHETSNVYRHRRSMLVHWGSTTRWLNTYIKLERARAMDWAARQTICIKLCTGNDRDLGGKNQNVRTEDEPREWVGFRERWDVSTDIA